MNKFIKLKPYFRASAKSYHLFKSLILRRKISQNLSKGITLVELLLAMLVAGIIIQLAYFGFSWNRQLYLNDQARNDASQNLATVFSIVGSDIKQAGAGLDAGFPAVLITPYPTNPSGTPNLNSPTFPTFNSAITLRRLDLGTQPKICKNNAATPPTTISGSPTEIFVVNSSSTSSGIAGCPVSDRTTDTDVWDDEITALRNYRLQNGGTVRIFIYPSNDGANTGEFLNYTGEKFYDSTGTLINNLTSTTPFNSASLTVNGTLTKTYNIESSSTKLLVIEERKYQLGCSDSNIADASCPADKLQNLQLIVNNGNAVNLVNKIGNFAVTATIQQDITSTTTAQFLCWSITQAGVTTCSNNPPPSSPATTALPNSYAWSQLYSINVTLKPQPVSSTDPLFYTNTRDTLNNLQQTQKFLPRNVLNY
jgi:Tfp pilus assembly protein PilW